MDTTLTSTPSLGEDVAWPILLAKIVERAAEQAGLPARRGTHPGFDGDALTWTWREYLGGATVAADIRLGARQEEGSDRISTSITALAWPVDPKLRHMSLRVEEWSEDLQVSDIGLDRTDRPLLASRLAKRLVAARRAAGRAAQALVGQLTDGRPEETVRPEPPLEMPASDSVIRRAATSLTDSELQVVQLVGRGLTNRQIADQLGIKLSTIDSHLHNVRRKTDLRSRSQLGVLASQLGLLQS